MRSIVIPIFVILVIPVIWIETLFSQELRFRHLSHKDGLSQSSVYAIVQDLKGFIWIATGDGLNRYDGYEFSVLRHLPNDPHSLNQNAIWTLGVDSLGHLWIGLMSRGLDYLNTTTGKIHHFQHQPGDTTTLSSNRVRVIYCDRRGVVWVGTSDGGLNRLDAVTLKLTRVPAYEENCRRGLAGKKTNAVIEDGQGWLLVATEDGGITRLHPRTFQSWRVQISGDWGSIETIFLDQKNHLWIGFGQGGLWRSTVPWQEWINERAPSEEPLPGQLFSGASAASQVLQKSIVKAILQGIDGWLWIGTFTQGLFRLNSETGEIRHYNHQSFDPFSLTTDQVFCLFRDRSGLLWIGTNGGGINLLDGKLNRFQYFRLHPDKQRSLPDRMVRAVVTDSRNFIWVGTSHGGLCRIDPVTGNIDRVLETFSSTPTLSSSDVRSLLIDRHGYLWVGTYGAGLFRMKPSIVSPEWRTIPGTEPETVAGKQSQLPAIVFQPYRPPSDRSGHSIGKMVWCLLEDYRGWLWMGTSEGLLRLNPESQEWRLYAPNPADPQGLAHPIVRTLFLDENKHLWIGTYAGLHRFPLGGEEEVAGTFVRIKIIPNSMPGEISQAVSALWEFPAGYLWVGTYGGGLNLMEKTPAEEVWKHWDVSKGLPSDNVVAIRNDDQGNLWFSTTAGLCRVSWDQIQQLDDDALLPLQVFTEEDGLQSSEFNTGAAHRDEQGFLYFGGIAGLNRFRYDDAFDGHFPARTLIKQITILNQPLQADSLPEVLKSIRLSHRQNYFTISFAAPTFSNPQSVRYRYRLKGLQDEWIELAGRPIANYTNVPPGNYRFEVTARTSAGEWYVPATRLRIVVIPAFWQTIWFRLLIFSLILFSLYALHRYRLARVRELQAVRARIAADLHDDLSATLSSIRYFSEAIQSSAQKYLDARASNFLNLISQGAEESQEKIQDIIWAINSENDSWEQLLVKLRRYASDVLDSQGIEYTLEIPRQISAPSLNMEQRRNFWLIYKELLTNVVRHSRAEHAQITLAVKGKSIHLTVQDDGIGFDPVQASQRNGVKNIQQRVEELQGSWEVQTAPGEGTRWQIEF